MKLTESKANKIIDCLYEHILTSDENKNRTGEKRVNLRKIKEYLEPIDRKRRMIDIFQVYVFSLQNRSVMSNVVQLEKRDQKFLLKFDYRRIYSKYGDDVSKFLKAVQKDNSGININRKGNGLWKQFAKGVLDGAKFFLQFKTVPEFEKFITPFYRRKTEGAILLAQTLASGNLHGMKFALAMDFLKNSGTRISKYCVKPDIQLKDSVQRIKALKNGYGYKKEIRDEDVVRAIGSISEFVNLTNYQLDKLFWLAGSGNFYDDRKISRLWHKTECPKKRLALAKRINKATC